ncbi:MAG: hypothetical protein HY840_05205 [Bacteroidetes bacterium]|nr:hypothetical protein [Bacteroidota bacterium]
MNTYTTIQTKVVSFRVNHEEYNKLLDAANADGQKIGHYCYNKVLAAASAEPKKEKPPSFDSDGTLSIEENIKRLDEKLKLTTK